MNVFKTGESGSEPYTMPPLLTTAVLKTNQPVDSPSKKLKRIKRTTKIAIKKSSTARAKTSEGNSFYSMIETRMIFYCLM